jgi:hypothetical protein
VELKVEEKIPDDNSLVVFRKRLGEERFERLFNRISETAKEEGLLKERYKIVDATAIVADGAIPNTVNLLRQGRRVVLKEISNKEPRTAKKLETEYQCREKLSQKPTEEGLVEEVKKSRSFIKGIKGRYGEEI